MVICYEKKHGEKLAAIPHVKIFHPDRAMEPLSLPLVTDIITGSNLLEAGGKKQVLLKTEKDLCHRKGP